MKEKCRLLCIDPQQVEQFWPYVSPLIKAALKKGRLSNYTDVEQSVMAGNCIVWIAWDGAQIKAAAVTEIHVVNGEKIFTIVALGGHDRHEWYGHKGALEDYARSLGCKTSRVYGRFGWKKLLPDYRVTRVLLEKAL